MSDGVFWDVAKNNSFGLALVYSTQSGFKIQRILIAENAEAFEGEAILSGAKAGFSCKESRKSLSEIAGILDGGSPDRVFGLLDASRLNGFHSIVLKRLYSSTPRGSVVSYGQLAALCGNPGAARAVGMAMASNPFPIVLPCHRVLGVHGRIGGFGGGLPLKRLFLEREGVVFEKCRVPMKYFISS